MTHLKRLRILRGISQVELAKLLGVTRSTVSRWENNERELSAKHLIKLSELFGVSVDEILKGGN